MLSAIFSQHHKYARNAECRYEECLYTKCRYDGCRYAECHGAAKKPDLIVIFVHNLLSLIESINVQVLKKRPCTVHLSTKLFECGWLFVKTSLNARAGIHQTS